MYQVGWGKIYFPLLGTLLRVFHHLRSHHWRYKYNIPHLEPSRSWQQYVHRCKRVITRLSSSTAVREHNMFNVYYFKLLSFYFCSGSEFRYYTNFLKYVYVQLSYFYEFYFEVREYYKIFMRRGPGSDRDKKHWSTWKIALILALFQLRNFVFFFLLLTENCPNSCSQYLRFL